METLTREQKNRRYSVNRYMRQGMTREQAEAHYDRPRGVCQHCGRQAHSERARTCIKCQKRQDYERATRWAKVNRRKPAPKLPDFSKTNVKTYKVVPGRKQGGMLTRPPDEPRKPEIIITPPDVKVQRVPSMLPTSLRNLFGDSEGNSWDASA